MTSKGHVEFSKKNTFRTKLLEKREGERDKENEMDRESVRRG